MARLINENDVYALFGVNGTAHLHVGDIDVLPRVDAMEVIHGQWIRTGTKNVYGGIEIRCSQCGHTLMTSPHHIEKEHFCCNCGAKMDGGNVNEVRGKANE